MITMNELVDLRMQQHIAHEIYRQQIMQRIPDPFPQMLPIPIPRHVIMPPRVTLPGVEVTLQNDDLWKQFHHIGTEMIITKCGRRMFPSMRLSLAGLEEECNYCVLLEMVPLGDCRYKFSGSQWVPAGGAEPQSPQRMYLHPDSPASGLHWQAQPILFNKVKLTNNTLDNNGHIVLASMHKYQPRIHVIRTSDLSQIPWAPQQAFVFPETEFIAVTAYQHDHITKLKIDHNPFAKGFRETGQSRCKRKMSSSPMVEDQDHAHQQQQQQQHQQQHPQHSQHPHHSHHSQHPQQQHQNDMSPTKSTTTMSSDSGSSICCDKSALYDADDGPRIKRMRSNGSACSASSLDDVNVVGVDASVGLSSVSPSSETSSPNAPPPHASDYRQQANVAFVNSGAGATSSFMHHFQQNMQTLLRPSLVDLACSYFGRPQPIYPPHVYPQHAALVVGSQHVVDVAAAAAATALQLPVLELPNRVSDIIASTAELTDELEVEVEVELEVPDEATLPAEPPVAQQDTQATKSPPKKKSFSISALLGGST